ncbi:hypothetical protein N7E81_01110 [Reichenbachiella carrageenanivorans]|uniref:His Kinase A (Phospho-acceptor) domain-containing protein n=1 Tax=Reichenbachiella carrageenanivorans TaxID=2979869 RepID=A0ABY6D267_9BACT|nr:hypothetical protein [Reichenbachiella carrageenanivorans]UXX79710.1 hypothetical protein N7E81_01110 [Reichenbachiella carrageenanivorans]
MKYIQYKSELLDKTAQLVVLNQNGRFLDSCHTLEDLSDFEGTIFKKSHFLNSNKIQILDLQVGEVLNFFCVTDSFFSSDHICDYRIEKVAVEGQYHYHWFIQDHTQLYKEIIERELGEKGVVKENQDLRQTIRELEQEKIINQAIYNKLHHEIKTPIAGLKFLSKSISEHLEAETKKRYQLSCGIITSYLEHAVNQLTANELKETNTPFKIDQIIAAVEDTFLGETDVHLVFEKEFESSIVIGNKHKLYTGIVRLISIINESRPDGHVRVIFAYDTPTRSIRLTFKSNLLPDAQQRMAQKYLEVSGSFDLRAEKGALVITCPVEEIKMLKTSADKKSKSEVKEITKAHFPYLYQITNQDDEMVRDIIEGVLDVVPFELEKMMKQYEARDFDALARTSHKVKPNFENLEQKQFISKIFEIEEAAINKNDTYLNMNLELFVREASAKIEELKSIYT